MLYVDLPTRSEFAALHEKRADACVSIYVETTPLTQQADASRTSLSNLYRQGRDQLVDAGFDKRRLAAIDEQIDDLLDDDDFWRLQAKSLALLATPDSLRTYRLANHLTSMVMVSDRFHLNPLLRAITFPNACLVLAISENAVRLVQVEAGLPPSPVKVDGLPKDAASAVGKSTLNDRGPSGRIHGSEGQNVRLRQYARRVDAALRPLLSGRETPLLLAANERLAAIYRSINSYPHLVPEVITTATDRSSDDELAAAARAVLDRMNADRVIELKSEFGKRLTSGRATTDITDAARAATLGAIDLLLVDIDGDIPGTVDETTGAVSFADAPSAGTYDVVDEIAGRALATGAQVMGVRKGDLPENGELAAMLRFAT